MPVEQLRRLALVDQVIGQDLRIDDAIAVIAIETGVEPVERLVDLGAGAKVSRIAGRAGQIGEVTQDRRGFEQAEAAIDQGRHGAVRVHFGEGLGEMLAHGQVDMDELDVELVLEQKQRQRSTHGRRRIMIQLHFLVPNGCRSAASPHRRILYWAARSA